MQGAVKKHKSLEEFSFLRLMESLIINVAAGYKSLRSGKKKCSLSSAKKSTFALQVRIFQEVLPTKFVLIFTDACI